MQREIVDEVPATLLALIQDDSHRGFRLALGHFLQLEHGLMGTFPAVESISGEIILSTDRDVVQKVLQMLPARQSKMGTQLIYVNAEGIAYSVVGTLDHQLENTKPYRIFTAERFDELSARSKKPFKWAPGLISSDMTQDEFIETLNAGRQRECD